MNKFQIRSKFSGINLWNHEGKGSSKLVIKTTRESVPLKLVTRGLKRWMGKGAASRILALRGLLPLPCRQRVSILTTIERHLELERRQRAIRFIILSIPWNTTFPHWIRNKEGKGTRRNVRSHSTWESRFFFEPSFFHVRSWLSIHSSLKAIPVGGLISC